MKYLMLKCFKNFFLENSKVFSEQSVYGITIYLTPEMQSLLCVIGTEQCLNECVEEYDSLGWRNTEKNNIEGFNTWLRWAGPEESAWVGIHSNAFNEFNESLLAKIRNDEIELFSDYISNLLIDNIDILRELCPIKNIPIVCTYYEHNFELEVINKKLNSAEIYKKYETEVNATLEMNKKVEKVKA